MNNKITLIHLLAIFRRRIPIPMVVFFSFMLLIVTSASAQTLKTDSNIPLLSVCGDYQQLTVRIAKGSRACSQGKLKIEIPVGFELETGSVKANGNTVTVTGETGQGTTVNLPNITAGPSSEEMVVTYNVKALCSVIGSAIPADQQVVSYVFSGCTTNPQSGTSEIINIDFAVLRVSINPAISSGNVGDEITRTVTIRNQGNGAISTVVLERILGGGLNHLSYDFSAALGWTVEASNPNKITFSGATLASGGTISFKEKVKINSCSLTPTIYEVYYGCGTKCTNSSVSGDAQHIININNSFRPSIEVSAIPPVITCLNQTYTNTWNVKNTGNAEASSVGLEIGTNDANGYIDINTVIVGGVAVNPADIEILEGTAAKPTLIKVKISADNTLDPNQVVVVKFDQFYAAPNAAACETAPTTFTTNDNYYKLAYDFTGGCGGPYTDTKTVSPAVTYNYEGLNIGEIDIVSGQPYGADYLFTNFVIPHAGLSIGDKFEITIELSELLTVANINDIKLFTGATAVNAVPSADGANKYRLTFTYGTAPWTVGSDLDLSNSRLKFPIDFLCGPDTDPGEVQDVWYKIGGELIKTPACDAIVFKCNQVDLLGYCDAGPCADGLHNRSADLERTTLGYAVNATGVPTNTRVNKNDTNVRTFITGDILEIHQDSDVIITTPGAWTKVKFQIEKDAETNVALMANSGKLVVTRAATETVFDGLTVVENPTNYVLEFDLLTQPNLLLFFLQGDKVRFSMQFKALDSQVGLKKFPTKSYLIDSNGVEKICGRAYTATGFYVNKNVDFKGHKTSFETCINSDNTAVITASILGFPRQDGVFPGEFRDLFEPVSATLTIPENLKLTEVKVVIKNQPWLGVNNTALVAGLDVTNGNYVLDLNSILLGLTTGRNLDEGFAIEITPTVSLFECEPSTTAKTQSIAVVLEGNTVDGAGDKTPFTATQQLEYNTGYGSLTLELSNNNLNGEMSPNGQLVSWVVKIANTSDSRAFSNVWLGKKAGNLTIESVQKVDNYDGTNPLVAIVPNGDVYRLGDFAASTTNFYLVKANLINCSVESLTIPLGYSCDDYPVNVNSGTCVVTDKVLTYGQLKNNLQTTIVYQSNANTQHGFCDVLSYTVQIHNAGDTNVKNLSVRIPLASAPGLKYNGAFQYSAVFSGNITPGVAFTNGNPASAVVSGTDLVITLDNSISLNTLERVQLKVDFKIDNCDFRSGQRISFTPAAVNVCGSPLPAGSITSASGNRIIVAGGATAFPELVLNLNEVQLDPVVDLGGNLRAKFNFSTTNSGNFGNTDAITTDYRFSFKFPPNWVIVGNPIDYIVPAAEAFVYVGIDSDRGYVFRVNKNLPVGTVVKMVDVPLKYVGHDDTILSCEHNFGDVEVAVYQNIPVPTCLNPDLSCPDGIDQVLLEDQIPMILPIDTMLMINPPQQTREICSPLVGGGQPTLADITFTNGYYLSWYENELDAQAEVTPLPLTTQLIHNRTYYVVNRFIAGGLCKSNLAAIKVLLKTNNLQATNIEFACAPDQRSYKVFVTLNGTAPYTAVGTGVGAESSFDGNIWTSESIPIGTPYDVTFENASMCTPLTITGIPPVCCSLQITCPVDVEVVCGTSYDPSVTGIPTANTACGNITHTYTDSPITACVAGLRTFTRTFTVTDGSGNVEVCTQRISIKDVVAPVLDVPAKNLTVECGTNTTEALNNWLASHGGAIATDACGAVTWSHNFTALTAGLCAGTQSATVAFTATDACGNRVTSTAKFTIEDKTPPVISIVAENKTVECDGAGNTAALNDWLASHGGAVATDGCSVTPVTWSHNFTVLTAGTCAGSQNAIVTFTATDACNNKSTTTATFAIVDTTAPTITVAPQNLTVECDGLGNLDAFNAWLATSGGAVATDGCGTVTWSYLIEDTNTTCGKAGTVIVDFFAKDSCGNTSFKQAAFIIVDTTKPVISTPAKALTVECGSDLDALNAWLNNHGGAISSDNCGTITWTHNYNGLTAACGNTGSAEVTFTATDSCGNFEVTVATITIEDKTPPTITKPTQNLTVACGANTEETLNNWLANNAGATATDACGTVTWKHDFTDLTTAACGTTGSALVTFTATDACGNTVTTTATYTVEDKTVPVITRAAQNKTVECDASGNTAELTAWLAANGGATATDSCSALTWSNDYVSLTAGCGATGSALVTFTATDACGNKVSSTATFSIADTIAPEMTTLPQDAVVECDGAGNTAAFNTWLANHGGAVATDACSTDLTWSYSIVDTSNLCGKTKVTTVNFVATDSCGNAVTKQATFTIADTTNPIIATAAIDVIIECSADANALNVWLNNHGGAVATDDCGTITWSHNYNGLTAACGNTGSAVVTFRATDSCGNFTETVANVSVVDRTPPTMTKQAQNLTVACGTNAEQTLNNWLINNGGAEATDSCGTVSWSHNYIELTTRTCGVTGFALVTFTATDACGNTATTTATYKVEDTTAPVITHQAENNIVECDGTNYRTAMNLWLLNHGGATVAQTCSDVTWTNNFTVLSAGETGTAEVTFTATDACGNWVSTTATYTVVDRTAPVITVLPQNQTVECDGAGNLDEFQAWLDSHAGAVATDNCGDVTWSYLIEDTNTTCGKAGTVIVDFIVKDAFGNTTFKQAAFIIKDTTKPVVSTVAKDLIIECGAEVDALNAWLNNHGGAVASDNCGTITWTHNYNGLTAACGNTGSAVVTFTATDSCGNFSETVATISLVDTVAPTLVKAGQDLTVACGANTAEALNNWLISHAGAVARDACGTVTWTHDYTDLTTTACGTTGSALVTFTAKDACGNTVTTSATYTVEDKAVPVITRAAQNKTVECDGSGNATELNAWLASQGGATATDSCSAVTWTNDYVSLTAACGTTGNALVTFTATDACRNTVTTTATFTIVDTKAPIMTTVPQNTVVECDGAGNTAAFDTWLNSHAGAVATDACSTTVTWSHSIVDTSNLCGKTKVTTVNFVATDACGNAVTKQATFTIADTTGPIITRQATDLIMECGTSGNDRITTWLNSHGGASATEACGSVTWSHNYTGLTAACGATGNAVVTFTATDSCGNTTVTVANISIVDTIAPTLVKEAQDLTVACGTNTTEALNNWLSSRAGARATDTCSSVTWTNNYSALTAACGATGSALVTFTATDACGNTVTTTATFTIEDKTVPVITRAAQNKTVECDGSGNTTELNAWLAIQGGATATDSCSAVTWSNDYTALTTACGTTGSALVTFTATDACGNKVTTTATFTIVDTTAPIMTTAPQNAVVECDGAGNLTEFNAWLANQGGAVAADTCSGVTWSYVVVDTSNLCGKTQVITVNFTATDACGNSVMKQGTFTTVNTTGPQFVVEAQDLTVNCDGNGNANDLMAWLNTHGGANAVNACSLDLTWTNDFKGLTKACGSTGSTVVTFKVTDSCGNVSTTTATFTIVDTTAPVFTTNLPKDITLECSALLPEAAVLNATDLCGTAEVSFKEERINGNCENNYQLVRTWTATDACGNAVVHVQTITIQDTTAPVFVEPLPTADVFMKCEDLKPAQVMTATDACGKATVVFTEEKVQGDCDNKYSLERTWTATDTCGNETVYTQTVHLACEIEIYNAISANGDGNNDEFVLKGINCYPGNTVEIFDRWGRLVYSTRNYNSIGNVFKGYANAKDVVSKGEKLPTGTYFYVVQYDYNFGNGASQPMKQSGYIHLESN